MYFFVIFKFRCLSKLTIRRTLRLAARAPPDHLLRKNVAGNNSKAIHHCGCYLLAKYQWQNVLTVATSYALRYGSFACQSRRLPSSDDDDVTMTIKLEKQTRWFENSGVNQEESTFESAVNMGASHSVFTEAELDDYQVRNDWVFGPKKFPTTGQHRRLSFIMSYVMANLSLFMSVVSAISSAIIIQRHCSLYVYTWR